MNDNLVYLVYYSYNKFFNKVYHRSISNYLTQNFTDTFYKFTDFNNYSTEILAFRSIVELLKSKTSQSKIKDYNTKSLQKQRLQRA